MNAPKNRTAPRRAAGSASGLSTSLTQVTTQHAKTTANSSEKTNLYTKVSGDESVRLIHTSLLTRIFHPGRDAPQFSEGGHLRIVAPFVKCRIVYGCSTDVLFTISTLEGRHNEPPEADVSSEVGEVAAQRPNLVRPLGGWMLTLLRCRSAGCHSHCPGSRDRLLAAAEGCWEAAVAGIADREGHSVLSSLGVAELRAAAG